MKLSPYREPAKRDDADPVRPSRTVAPRALGSFRSHHGIEVAKHLKRPGIVAGVLIALMLVLRPGSLPGVLFVLMFPGGFFVAALLGVVSLRGRGVVDLHSGGLVLKTPDLRTEVLFDDVDEVWLDVVDDAQRNIRGVRLKRFDGREVHVHLVLEDAQRLLDTIQKECSAHLVPEAQRALAEGESLDFRELKLSAQGFWHGKHLVPWENVAAVRLTIDSLVFDLEWKDAPRSLFRVAIRAVPHPHVLIRLVKHLVGARAQV